MPTMRKTALSSLLARHVITRVQRAAIALYLHVQTTERWKAVAGIVVCQPRMQGHKLGDAVRLASPAHDEARMWPQWQAQPDGQTRYTIPTAWHVMRGLRFADKSWETPSTEPIAAGT